MRESILNNLETQSVISFWNDKNLLVFLTMIEQ